MRRLEYHQKKQLTITIITTLVILFLVLFFIFTVGIKILLNTSAFIATLTNKNTVKPLIKTTDVIGSIDIDSVASATNSARVMISGSVINFSVLDFYLNNEKVKETTLTASDNFSEEIGDLRKGNNELYIIGSLKDNPTRKKSKVYNIFYKSDKLKLEIKEPNDGAKTNKQEIKIRGVTDRDTFVRINDQPAVVDSQGNFEMTIKLKEGDNKIQITAQDIAGNTELRELKLIYEKD